jgi:hypothetical protein
MAGPMHQGKNGAWHRGGYELESKLRFDSKKRRFAYKLNSLRNLMRAEEAGVLINLPVWIRLAL